MSSTGGPMPTELAADREAAPAGEAFPRRRSFVIPRILRLR
jgi:hypothetical protein